MSKRTFRSISVKELEVTQLIEQVGDACVLGIDVAKQTQFVAVSSRVDVYEALVRFEHPTETRCFYEFVDRLLAADVQVKVALEATGSYGEPLREGLLQRGVQVYRVPAHHVRASAENFDGSPSLHDGKAAMQIARACHREPLNPWRPTPAEQRDLRAATDCLGLYEDMWGRLVNRLEACLAKHWPELSRGLALDSATVLMLLTEFGGPAQVVRRADEARTRMQQVGGSFLRPAKIDAIIDGAATTTGVPIRAEELRLVQIVARELQEAKRHLNAERKRVEALQTPVHDTPLAGLVGRVTVATLIANSLNPLDYDSPSQLVRAFGLQLVVDQSGKSKRGRPHISKRGSAKGRQLLYFATLRLIKNDAVVGAYFRKKRERDGGRSGVNGVVAVMRKLVRAMWHVARGNEFDATKLFDTTRLKQWIKRDTATSEAA
jgi:transposase